MLVPHPSSDTRCLLQNGMLGWLMSMPGRVRYTLVLCSGLEVSHFEVEITTGIKISRVSNDQMWPMFFSNQLVFTKILFCFPNDFKPYHKQKHTIRTYLKILSRERLCENFFQKRTCNLHISHFQIFESSHPDSQSFDAPQILMSPLFTSQNVTWSVSHSKISISSHLHLYNGIPRASWHSHLHSLNFSSFEFYHLISRSFHNRHKRFLSAVHRGLRKMQVDTRKNQTRETAKKLSKWKKVKNFVKTEQKQNNKHP